MRTSDFEYKLPEELIAQAPCATRDASRMMVIDRSTDGCEHRCVMDIGEYLNPGDVLVVNDTKVFPARIFGERLGTGGRIELLLIEEHEPGVWESMCRASRPVRVGAEFVLADGALRGEVLSRGEGGRIMIRLSGEHPVMQILEESGVPPVPPYIRREAGDTMVGVDRERYQTVYAQEVGAVAAPTAGLHFTPTLLASLEQKGVKRVSVTLHVGPGTFRPVKTERVEDHVMESERYVVSEATAQAIAEARDRGGRIVAVGSTSVRTLETVAARHGRVVADAGRSELFIRPPYDFKVVDAMLTNFHLPRSSLLMMVSALAGRDRMLSAYREAVRECYRFYSYGDCMLIL